MQSISNAVNTPQPPEAAFAEYRSCRSPHAFEQLMRNYVDLVYASALRQLRDRDQAEDATQVVFTVLAVKAHKLRPDTVLPAWLLKVTRYTVLDARRRRKRRQHHELVAQQIRDEQGTSAMNTAGPVDSGFNSEGIADEGLRAVLDEGVARLNRSERSAVVLRYFEGKSHGDIAAALGIREDAARKRVQRGLEKLRAFFATRGAIASTAPASAIVTALGAHARVPAPASLVSHLTTHAPSMVAAAAASSMASSLTASAKGVITLMAWTNAKPALVAVLIVLLAGGGVVAVHAISARSRDDVVVTRPGPNSGASVLSTTSDELMNTTDAAADYTLAPDRVLKRIPTPSPPARKRLGSFGGNQKPVSITIEWGGTPQLRSQTYGGQGQSLEGMLTNVVGLSTFDFEIPRDLSDGDFPGDWIVRKGATSDQLMPALEAILGHSGRPLRFEKRRVKRDVIIARGSFHFQPTDNTRGSPGVNLYSDTLNESGRGGGATVDLQGFFTNAGSMLHRRMINQAAPWRGQFDLRYHDSGDLRYARPGPDTEKKLDQILANLSRQTGLTFEKTTADQDVWFVTSTAPANP